MFHDGVNGRGAKRDSLGATGAAMVGHVGGRHESRAPGVGSRDRRIRSGSDSTILDRGGCHLDLGWRHPAQGLMSLIGSTWGALGGSRAWRGGTHVPGEWSRACRPRGVPACPILDRVRRHLGSGRRHPGSGLNESDWEHLRWPRRVTWVAVEGH